MKTIDEIRRYLEIKISAMLVTEIDSSKFTSRRYYNSLSFNYSAYSYIPDLCLLVISDDFCISTSWLNPYHMETYEIFCSIITELFPYATIIGSKIVTDLTTEQKLEYTLEYFS